MDNLYHTSVTVINIRFWVFELTLKFKEYFVKLIFNNMSWYERNQPTSRHHYLNIDRRNSILDWLLSSPLLVNHLANVSGRYQRSIEFMYIEVKVFDKGNTYSPITFHY